MMAIKTRWASQPLCCRFQGDGTCALGPGACGGCLIREMRSPSMADGWHASVVPEAFDGPWYLRRRFRIQSKLA